MPTHEDQCRDPDGPAPRPCVTRDITECPRPCVGKHLHSRLAVRTRYAGQVATRDLAEGASASARADSSNHHDDAGDGFPQTRVIDLFHEERTVWEHLTIAYCSARFALPDPTSGEHHLTQLGVPHVA